MARRKDEEGSAIILAIVFVFGVSLALWALVSFTGGALLNSGNLRSQRATEYSADNATDMAIQAVRYRPSAFTTSASCLGPASETFNGVAMQVVCSGTQNSFLPQSAPGSIAASSKSTATSTVLFTSSLTSSFFVGWTITDPTSSGGSNVIPSGTTITAENNSTNSVTMSQSATAAASSDSFVLFPPEVRNVTFYTCTTSVASCSSSTALVTAVVAFNDVSATGSYACSTSTSQTCGSGMTIKQWSVHTANG
jgi:hypothetical protein